MEDRRTVRLRRDYLYERARAAELRARNERKLRLQAALATGTRLSKRDHAAVAGTTTTSKDLFYDDYLGKDGENEATAAAAGLASLDCEYSHANNNNNGALPRILVTTSRDPSARLLQFAKEMKLVIPNSQRINRGNQVIKDLVDACRQNNVTDLVLLHEHRGTPDTLIVSHLPHGPTLFCSLHNVVLRHDVPGVGTMSEAYPNLIFNNFATRLGHRVVQIFKHLFPSMPEASKRVLTFANQDDYISFRHHVFIAPKQTNNQRHPPPPPPSSSLLSEEKRKHEEEGEGEEERKKEKEASSLARRVQIAEVGPRFELKPFKIMQGTIDVREADVEWALRPYHRTARKRRLL